MNKDIDLNDIFPIIEEQLLNGGTATFTVRGTSMNPLFADRKSIVRIAKCEKMPRKYDIIFYRRNEGMFILHRIVGIKDDGFICRGDNQFENEFPIGLDSIIGIVTEYNNHGKFEKICSFKQMVYSRFWVNTMIFRRSWRKIINRIKKK